MSDLGEAEAVSGSLPIAIVGIGCRYADARGPDEFWEIMRSGRNTVRDAPQHRIELGYDIDHFYDPRPRIPGKISSKKGGFLEHPELFDPAPFGIAPRDALTMEPQQRLMVEVTWDALEDAGIVPESLAGERVALMLGYMAEDYSRERAGVLGEAAVYRGHDVFTVGGMSHAVLSGRISFLLGVTGPSLTLDTACSSSLYATHLACESLRRGESKMAIAGGVNLFLSPEGNIALSRSGMLSMSGACKAFDASADGFVRAEGAGVVVLRPLADALEDGNPVYAVIRGSGVSSDGRDGGHMMAPGRKGQAQAMRDAYRQAGISPADVQYVETHGTGTMIGDPVEIAALADVMGPGRSPDRPLLVASAKGNLGHSESASGVAGLIKAALAIRHRELPAQVHFETPNPMIPWDEIPVRVQSETTPWPYPGRALVGVNSFGISGTNAHIVLESPPPPPRSSGARERVANSPDARGATDERRPTLVPLSGHEPNALFEMVQAQHAQLEGEHSPDFTDLAYTLARRRTQRTERLAIVADSSEELRSELAAHLAGQASGAVLSGRATADAAKGLTLIFPGQGGQWLGMGRELLTREPVFAESIERIDAAYRTHVDWSLRGVLDGTADIDWSQRLDILQPVLIAIEVALAELFGHFGVHPARVIGQSLGEVAAAHVAGCLSRQDMALIACERGRVVARASGSGAMAVAALSRAAVEESLERYAGHLEIAGANGPATTIVSGDAKELVAWVDELDRAGTFVRRLEVDFASHCFHMDPLLEDFRARIQGITPTSGHAPFFSTVDGIEVSGEQLDVDYWVRNLREPVAFDRGFEAVLAAGTTIALEISPHASLARPVSEIASSVGASVTHVGSLARRQDESRALMTSLAALFVRGIEIDFAVLHPAGQVVPTPLYAYQRKRFWFSERSRLDQERPTHPLLGVCSTSSFDPRWQTWDLPFDADSAGFVADYRVDGRVTAPAGLYPELALAVARATWPDATLRLSRLELRHALVLAPDGRRQIQVALREDGGPHAELRIASRVPGDAEWVLHAQGRLTVVPEAELASLADAVEALDRDGHQTRQPNDYFDALERCGITLGARARTLRELESSAPSDAGAPGTSVARLMLPRLVESEWYAYHAHPSLMDACLQLIGQQLSEPAAVRIRSIAELTLRSDLGSECWVRTRTRSLRAEAGTDAEEIEADLDLFDREGQLLGRIRSVRATAAPRLADSAGRAAEDLFEIEWQPLEMPSLSLQSRTGERSADGGSEGAAEMDVAPPACEIMHWLIVSDSADEARSLATELQKHGATCRFAEKVEDLERLARILREESHGRWGFALLAWHERAGEDGRESLPRRRFRVGSWANAIREHCVDAREIWIATRGLQPTDAGAEYAMGAAAWIASHVAQEIETFTTCAEMQQCRLFDASAALPHSERAGLAALMGRAGAERQFLARDGEIRVPRLIEASRARAGAERRSASGLREAGERNFRAVHRPREGAECLEFQEVPAIDEASVLAASPSSLVIDVRSAGLSQLDVLAGAGLLRDGSATNTGLAMDFCGVVVAAGSATRGWRAGDVVMGVHAAALARRIVVPETHLVRKPEFVNEAEAAAMVFPCLVARYVLEVVGRLRAGERVLVISGGGGVGHALVRVAHALGAEVVATAGSSERVASLRALGVTVLPHSGSRPFGPEAIAALGDPFDVIVGGGTGPAMHGALDCLASGGRYLDLCPRSRFERRDLGTLRLAANRSLSQIDVVDLLENDAPLVAALLEKTLEQAARGGFRPLPITRFPVSCAGRALRFMAQNRHVGRVCIDLDDAAEVRIRALDSTRALLAGRGSYVLSGEPPELLASLAEWLRTGGADAVHLIDGDPIGNAAPAWAAQPIAGWIHVTREQAPSDGQDVPDREAPAPDRAAGSAEHLAGPEDASGESWVARAAFHARVFVRTSRPAVDACAALGEAQSRAWETRLWIDRFRLAGASQSGRSLSFSVDHEHAAEAVERVLERFLGQNAAHSELVHFDAEDLAARIDAQGSPLLSELATQRSHSAQQQLLRADLLAMPPAERRAAMSAFVRDSLAGVLSLSERQREAIEMTSPLEAAGLDSLMTMELFMSFGRDLELEIAADWFGVAPTLAGIVDVLAERLDESGASGAGR